MTPSYPFEQPPVKTRKGLAIASLVLGILSIPTLGLLFIGALIGIILGAIALWKIKKSPTTYGGRGMAIAGIILSIGSVVFGVLSAAIAVPRLLENIKLGRQTAAIHTLETIHNAQARFLENNLRLGTLEDLAQAGLIDVGLAHGQPSSGYIFKTSDISDKTYCAYAKRTSESSAYRDFIVCEDGIIRYLESRSPRTLQRGEGTPLNNER